MASKLKNTPTPSSELFISEVTRQVFNYDISWCIATIRQNAQGIVPAVVIIDTDEAHTQLLDGVTYFRSVPLGADKVQQAVERHDFVETVRTSKEQDPVELWNEIAKRTQKLLQELAATR